MIPNVVCRAKRSLALKGQRLAAVLLLTGLGAGLAQGAGPLPPGQLAAELDRFAREGPTMALEAGTGVGHPRRENDDKEVVVERPTPAA
jgi:hypothetical protein